MEISVNRIKSNSEETLGELYVNGAFACYTLEDEYREVKKMAETRIPQGTYEIKLRKVGGHHMRYAKRFPSIHAGMIWLQDVPNFQYILIHCGNTDKDTAGCLLVGSGYIEDNGRYKITASTKAYVELYPRIAEELEKGNKVFITIVDSDRLNK